MTRIRSSLSSLPSGPTSLGELEKMAKAAWIKRRVAIIWPDMISNDFDRQVIFNICDALYGKPDASD